MRGCTNRFILWTIFIKRHGWGDISASAHAFLAFLGYLWFSMGIIKVARWNGLEILFPKNMWKSKIGLLEQIWGQNPYDAFFLGHPVLVVQPLSWSPKLRIWSWSGPKGQISPEKVLIFPLNKYNLWKNSVNGPKKSGFLLECPWFSPSIRQIRLSPEIKIPYYYSN